MLDFCFGFSGVSSAGNSTGIDPLQELLSKPFHKELFPSDKKVTEAHIRAVTDDKSLHWTDDQVKQVLAGIELVKKDARQWGKHRLEMKVTERVRENREDASINTIEDVIAVWKENGQDEDVQGIMWDACFKLFDEIPFWDKKLEDEYMDMKAYSYRLDSAPGKGCFQRTMSLCKVDMVKRMNRASSKTHGGVIKLKRTAEEVRRDEQGGVSRHVKRKKGTTLGAFYSAGPDCVRYNPEAAIAKILDGKKKSASPKKKQKKKQKKTPSPKKKQKKTPSPKKQPSLSSPASTKTSSTTEFCHAVTTPTSPTTTPNIDIDISPLSTSTSTEPFFDEDVLREAKIAETRHALKELGKDPGDGEMLRSVELLRLERELADARKENAKLQKLSLEHAKATSETATAQKKKTLNEKLKGAKKKKNVKNTKTTKVSKKDKKLDDFFVANNTSTPSKANTSTSTPPKADTPSDDGEPEPCEILAHKETKDDQPILLKVKWLGVKKSVCWMKLYDMWPDYQKKVLAYRGKHGLSKHKRWAKPSLATIQYPVRIVSMSNRQDFQKSMYCVVWDNGHMIHTMKYDELMKDGGAELLNKFLADEGLHGEC